MADQIDNSMNIIKALKKGFKAGKKAYKQERDIEEIFGDQPDYTIHEPIWNGGKRCIGLNINHFKKDDFKFNIDYKNKDGQLLYPGMFRPPKNIEKYPIQPAKRNPNVRLKIIPIKDLEVV